MDTNVGFLDCSCPFDYHRSDCPDGRPAITESQAIRERAKAEYAALSPEAKAEVDQRWADTPEWRKQDLRDEIEFDLL